MADEDIKCPICHNKIVEDRKLRGADGTDSNGDPLPFWSEDPLLTPRGLAGDKFKGATPQRRLHILELQQYYMELEEQYLAEEDRTNFSEVTLSEPWRHIHIEELRISVEKILISVGLTKELDGVINADLLQYFKYTRTGEEIEGITQSEWTDVERTFQVDGGGNIISDKSKLPLINKRVPTRAIQIEELRIGISIFKLEQWIKTAGKDEEGVDFFPFPEEQEDIGTGYGPPPQGWWSDGANRTVTVMGDLGVYTLKSLNLKSNHTANKKFGYPGIDGVCSFVTDYTQNGQDSILHINTIGYYYGQSTVFEPTIAKSQSNESYLGLFEMTSEFDSEISMTPSSKFKLKVELSGKAAKVFNSQWVNPPDIGWRISYPTMIMRLNIKKDPIPEKLLLDPSLEANKEFVEIAFTDDPTYPTGDVWKVYPYSSFDGFIDFVELTFQDSYNAEIMLYDTENYNYKWTGIKIINWRLHVVLGSYSETGDGTQNGSIPDMVFNIDKFGIIDTEGETE